MINLSQIQLHSLSDYASDVFLSRVKRHLISEQPELVNTHSESELGALLRNALNDAKTLNIEIEKDVYDFIVLSLKHGNGFYERPELNMDIDWLKSEYVPGKSKIKVLTESNLELLDEKKQGESKSNYG